MHEDETWPWVVQESERSLEVRHEHRWLGIFGFPLAAVGMIAGTALWFLPGIDYGEAWPLLAVGSLMGLFATLMGMHLTFNCEVFLADKQAGTLTHRYGFGPFTRIRRYPLDEIQEVSCQRVSDPGSRGCRYVVTLVAKTYSRRVAAFIDAEPVELEALRWSIFLDVPLRAETSVSSHEQRLRRELRKRNA